MDDELRALFIATELRAHLVTMSRGARKRLVAGILEGLCRSCGGPADHAFCDAETDFSPLPTDDEPYEELTVTPTAGWERKAAVVKEDGRPYAGYYCYVKGQPRTLEQWKSK